MEVSFLRRAAMKRGMKLTRYRHPIRIDANTCKGIPCTNTLTRDLSSPEGCHEMEFDQLVFVHAYALLGSSPQRFGTDLQLYLSTVNTFFDWQASTGNRHVTLAGVSATDAKRRLSEDLGAVLSSLFMVNTYGVAWETIAQIPMNNKLSKKRPDFEGFDSSDQRYLFEAKGTTSLSSVEGALHKAIDQVKKYPEAAASKLAIVTYLAADERLFPSQTFVVDPPSLPDTVPPTREVATLLHGEKLFEFAGMPETAAAYVKGLARRLKVKPVEPSRVTVQDAAPRRSFDHERRGAAVQTRDFNNKKYLGHAVSIPNSSLRLYFGVAQDRLEKLLDFSPIEKRDPRSDQSGEKWSSFADDSLVLIE